MFSINAPYDYSIYICIYESFKITLVNGIKKDQAYFFLHMDIVLLFFFYSFIYI